MIINIKKGGEMMGMTKQKKAVLDAVQSPADHPTADEIYAIAKIAVPNIGLGTVYRNLNTLCSEGIIKKIEPPLRPYLFVSYSLCKPYRARAEKGDVFLVENGVAGSVDAVHIVTQRGSLLQGGNAYATAEVLLVGGVEAFGGAFEHHAFATLGEEGSLQKPRHILGEVFGFHEKQVVAVGYAVEVHKELVRHGILVGFLKGGGAHKTHLLHVEKDEGAF